MHKRAHFLNLEMKSNYWGVFYSIETRILMSLPARAPTRRRDWHSRAAAAVWGSRSCSTLNPTRTGRVSYPQQLLQVSEQSVWWVVILPCVLRRVSECELEEITNEIEVPSVLDKGHMISLYASNVIHKSQWKTWRDQTSVFDINYFHTRCHWKEFCKVNCFERDVQNCPAFGGVS